MATSTPKLGLPRPSPSDAVNLANHNDLVDAIDDNAASQAEVDEIKSDVESVGDVAEKHADRHATGGADPLTPAAIGAAAESGNYANLRARATTKGDVGLGDVDNVKQATKSEFDSHVDNKNNPHDTDSEQITIAGSAPSESTSGSGSNYPAGVTIMTVTDDSSWPNEYGTILNIRNSSERFTQLFFGHRPDSEMAFFRHYHSGHGWSDWIEVADADALADLLSRYESHIDNTAAHGATPSDTPNRIMRRDSVGRASVGDATAGTHALNRQTADARYPQKDDVNALSVTVISSIEADVDGGDYPQGVTTMASSGDYPESEMSILNINPNHNYRFAQLAIGNGAAGNANMWARTWRTDEKWGPFREVWGESNNPASLDGGIGYQKFASGTIVMWGSSTLNSQDHTVNLPIAFPNRITQVTVTPDEDLARVAVDVSASRSNFRARHDFDGALRVRYIAFGY